MIHKDMRAHTIITTSWDDGSLVDLRLAKMLRKYGISATFYIPIRNKENECMDQIQIREIAKDFDIGAHTLSHVNLTKISPKQAEKEVLEGKRELERILRREVRTFCYPWGQYNPKVVNIVKKAGFLGARTTRYFETRIKDPFEIGTTIKVYNERLKAYYVKEYISSRFKGNPKLFLFLVRNGLLSEDWDEIAMNALDYVMKHSGIWHLWGHSHEIQRQNNWQKLESLLRNVKEVAETHKIPLMDNTQVLNYVNKLRDDQA